MVDNITLRERRLYIINTFSVLVSLALLILGIILKTQRDLATQQAATAQAGKSLAIQQIETAQTNVEAVKKQAKSSRANELAAQSSAERSTKLQRAMLLGIEAYQIDENARTKIVLFDNARADPSIQLFLGDIQVLVLQNSLQMEVF